mmetsp:Transcript_46121/g.133648  ORF Transcript_46121/g.133648 Transcript_46121/m.133648 type:complete len:209 (-) Transcript_46121:325-951(-)
MRCGARQNRPPRLPELHHKVRRRRGGPRLLRGPLRAPLQLFRRGLPERRSASALERQRCLWPLLPDLVPEAGRGTASPRARELWHLAPGPQRRDRHLHWGRESLSGSRGPVFAGAHRHQWRGPDDGVRGRGDGLDERGRGAGACEPDHVLARWQDAGLQASTEQARLDPHLLRPQHGRQQSNQLHRSRHRPQRSGCALRKEILCGKAP